MMLKQDYAIEVFGMPITTWLSVPSDEGDDGAPALTTDEVMVDRYAEFSVARGACKIAAAKYPKFAFRVGVVAPLGTQQEI